MSLEVGRAYGEKKIEKKIRSKWIIVKDILSLNVFI